LAKDPTASVLCPSCGKRDLVVEDMPLKWVGPEALRIEWSTPHFERWMRCPECGAKNHALMSKSDS
jgi:DNA-directed RNA polymerase subunit RPC12/RpoP